MTAKKEIKTIGVLTSGGDAPGMNAAIRAVVRTGISKGYEVYGVRRGYNGILNREMDLLTFHDVSEKLQHGGTFLFTARSAEFRHLSLSVVTDHLQELRTFQNMVLMLSVFLEL